MAPLPRSPADLALFQTRFAHTTTPSPTIPLSDLAVSSLELDQPRPDTSITTSPGAAPSTPLRHNLAARAAAPTFAAGQGTTPPGSINNAFFIALFAIIGSGMVLASLWFFFWAKNGGFHFREGDWDDYKSTVLRRKGPDGKTLSNATKSTKLGGSTIAGTQHYRWQKQAAKSVVSRDEKGRKGILGKRGWANTHSVTYSDDYMTDSLGTQTVTDATELRSEPDHSHHSRRYKDRDVQQYKKEKPARVGGLNRVADGSHFDGTTDHSASDVMSESWVQPEPQRAREQESDRAERKAREEAARMERRWKKEAQAAAAALARESTWAGPPPASPAAAAAAAAGSSAHPRRSATPSHPSPQKQRRNSRSASPKKKERDFSYQSGPASEVLSTAYTGDSSQRTASYYDEYRPNASENPRYASEQAEKRTRQSSPRKGGGGRRAKEGGYRRGMASDLD